MHLGGRIWVSSGLFAANVAELSVLVLMMIVLDLCPAWKTASFRDINPIIQSNMFHPSTTINSNEVIN